MTSPDKHKVLDALTLLHATCSDARAFLSGASVPHNTDERPPLDIILKDLTSLLSLIYASVTKLALALKPSSPAYSASLAPINDIVQHIAALSHCVHLISPTVDGATLHQEAITTVKDVIDAISSLAHTFSAADSNSNVGEQYLTKTGTVHSLIENGKALSQDNVAAVRKRWKQDKDSLADGINELHEIIMEAESGSDDVLEDLDDGWDELGLGPVRNMDANELGRSRKGYTLLRMAALLHKRILQDVLVSHLASHRPPDIYDKLSSLSSSLLVSADDFIASLYVPQNPLNIQAEQQAFQDIIAALRDMLIAHFIPTETPLVTQLEQMALSQSEQHAAIAPRLGSGSAKWFRTCFDQLDKATQALLTELG